MPKLTAALLAVALCSSNVEANVPGTRPEIVPRVFTVSNANRREAIVQAWVTRAGGTNWRFNILGGPIARGSSTRVVIASSIRDCVFDLRVRYASGRFANRTQVDLCSTDTVAFR